MVRPKPQPCKNKALPFTLEGLSEPSGSESSEGEEVQEQNEEPEQQETSSSRRINTGRRALVPRKRISHGRVYDSVLGITCHWCRQKTVQVDQVSCTAPGCKVNAYGKPKLPITFCGPCLRNRHGEDAIEAAATGAWVCPVCRGSCGPGCSSCCNCGPCRKKLGLEPTGRLAPLVRSSGFTNTHDFLIYQATGESAEAIAARKARHAWGLWTRPEREEACRGGPEGGGSGMAATGGGTQGWLRGSSEDASADGSDGLLRGNVERINSGLGDGSTGSLSRDGSLRGVSRDDRGHANRGGSADRGNAAQGGACAGQAVAFTPIPPDPLASPSPSNSPPHPQQNTRQSPPSLPLPTTTSQQRASATKHLPSSRASQQAPTAAPPPAPPPPRPFVTTNKPAQMNHLPSSVPRRATSPPPPTSSALLTSCASLEPPSGWAPAAPAEAHLQSPTAPPTLPPVQQQPPGPAPAQARPVQPSPLLLPVPPEASRSSEQAGNSSAAVDYPFTTPMVTRQDSSAAPPSPRMRQHSKHASRTRQGHASTSGAGTGFSPVRKCSLVSPGIQNADAGAHGVAGVGRRAGGGQGGGGAVASNGKAPGVGGGERSAGVGSGQEEPRTKRRRRMGSLEEAAQNASARLHAALQDLSTLKEQLLARRDAHRQEVNAHLAERARLISQDEALEKEENEIRLSLPHLYSLYEEYAAIMAQDSL